VTDQVPERILNEHPRLDFTNYSLYFVNGTELPVAPKNAGEAMRCTALWRGYVATFRLTGDGRLVLTHYEYPYSDIPGHDVENGLLTGDFSLVFRQTFWGPSVAVPFRDGYVVEDRSQWDIDDQTILATVGCIQNNGLYIWMNTLDTSGWVPRQYVLPEYAGDLSVLVGRELIVEIVKFYRERNNIVVRMLGLAAPREWFLDEIERRIEMDEYVRRTKEAALMADAGDG
jgi:hypothetical protein